uniref:Uncharacterized protein n=1 Tax=Sphaerodactylus townsendi TaxID=933632 RepID=A0ACB8ERE0_9SAUR
MHGFGRTSREDARAPDPPDLRSFLGTTAGPTQDTQQGSDVEPDDWEDQCVALARAKQDWELEREALEREREALELEREQFRRERDAEIAQEKEMLREQFLKDLERSRMVLDHTKQDLNRQRECVKALQTQGEVEAALQRQERERLRQERETLVRRERDLADKEAAT